MAFGLIQTHNLLIFYYAKEDIVTFTIIKSLRGVVNILLDVKVNIGKTRSVV